MTPTLNQLADAGYFSLLDSYFAKAMARIAKEDNSLSILGAAVASRFSSLGHICVDIKQLANTKVVSPEGVEINGFIWPDSTSWLDAMYKSPFISCEKSEPFQQRPLVIDKQDNLYLNRYWQYQHRLVNQLKKRVKLKADDVDLAILGKGLKRIFISDIDPDKQRIAAKTALLNKLTLISGGPGTGKTSTVVKIAALIVEQAIEAKKEIPKIYLAAPTGKAAARLKESVKNAKQDQGKTGIQCSDFVKQFIPEEAFTIHRLLGVQKYQPTNFYYNLDNPLPVDVMIVDEASMISLSLMTKLIEAIPSHARVILLGDKDQLASVEAGAIFGDLCQAGIKHQKIESDFDISKSTVTLTHNYRSGNKSSIDIIATAINKGDADKVIDCLEDKNMHEIKFIDLSDSNKLEKLLEKEVCQYYLAYINEKDTKKSIALFNRFRILCAHAKGREGVEAVNNIVERILKRNVGLDISREWYHGRPIMIIRNDYQLNLFNGDTGIIFSDNQGILSALFLGQDGDDRFFSPSRLPYHQTVYAMTVHKSQGSEFDHIMLILPGKISPVVTKELLYTGITRAKKSVTVFGTKDVIRQAVKTPVQRASGLTALLCSE